MLFLLPGAIERNSPEGRRKSQMSDAFRECYDRFYPNNQNDFASCLKSRVAPLMKDE